MKQKLKERERERASERLDVRVRACQSVERCESVCVYVREEEEEREKWVKQAKKDPPLVVK